MTLSTPHLLAHTLERPTPPLALVLPARLAQSVLEQLIDEGATSMGVKPALIIVGAEEEAGGIIRLAEKHGLVAVAWRDVEVAGNGVEDKAERQVVGEQDVFGLRIWEAPGGVRLPFLGGIRRRFVSSLTLTPPSCSSTRRSWRAGSLTST